MFKACCKKEILEEWRTKRFLRLSLFAVAMVVYALIILVLMKFITKFAVTDDSDNFMGTLTTMFEFTYLNYTMYFVSFMITYYSIIYIIMLMRAFSKEISQGKWILPISAGILPETMTSAKILVKCLSVICAELVAIILHLVTLLLFFKPQVGFGIGNVFLCYLGIIVFSLFMSNLTITINSISKRGWVSALTSICILILGTSILENIKVKDKLLINFTPMLYYELAQNPAIKVSAIEYIVGTVSLVAITFLMTFLSIKLNKVKPINKD